MRNQSRQGLPSETELNDLPSVVRPELHIHMKPEKWRRTCAANAIPFLRITPQSTPSDILPTQSVASISVRNI